MNISPNAIVLYIAVLCLTGCDNVTTEPLCGSEDSHPAQIIRIEYGTSFGYCVGYCWSRVTLSGSGTTFAKGGWNNSVDVVECTDGIPCPQKLSSIANGIDLAEFFALEEIIGCPDCADGGSEWIEIETPTVSHRVTYEYGNPPVELAPLAGELGILKSNFDNCE